MNGTLITELVCPRCGRAGEFELEILFGLFDLREFRIGDRVEWIKQGTTAKPESVELGVRPPDGTFDGAGYMVCPSCEKNAHVTVRVREDVIEAAQIDSGRAPYFE